MALTQSYAEMIAQASMGRERMWSISHEQLAPVIPLHPEEVFSTPVIGQDIAAGKLIETHNPCRLNKGTLNIGIYATELAWHRIGIYKPDSFDIDSSPPPVFFTGALGTSPKKHNSGVAQEFMADTAVVYKSQPRYYGPSRALSLNQDATEILGLFQAVRSNGVLGNIDSFLGYGESQGAMKLLCLAAIARRHGIHMEDMLAVAPCYLESLDISTPVNAARSAMHLVGMGVSAVRFAKEKGARDLWDLRHTVSSKEAHHTAAVLPVLLSGEAGRTLDDIPHDQLGEVIFFEKDGPSRPRHSKKQVDTRTKLKTKIIPEYGHVDGIMSPDAMILRARFMQRAWARAPAV